MAQLFSLDLIVRMDDFASDRKPKPEPAPSGSPPKPPKKTAWRFDDESPGDSRRDDVARRLLSEYSVRLADTNLSALDREKLQKNIEKLKEDIKQRVGEP